MLSPSLVKVPVRVPQASYPVSSSSVFRLFCNSVGIICFILHTANPRQASASSWLLHASMRYKTIRDGHTVTPHLDVFHGILLARDPYPPCTISSSVYDQIMVLAQLIHQLSVYRLQETAFTKVTLVHRPAFCRTPSRPPGPCFQWPLRRALSPVVSSRSCQGNIHCISFIPWYASPLG